jgi:hypothetical protein
MDQYLSAAVKLHQYLVANHWRNQALLGPDPGVRLNYRIGRFIKSYTRCLPWSDDYYYFQAQGYWVLSNWLLFIRTGEEEYAEIATRCSDYIISQQRDDGAWDYPNPEWKGRVTTYEGTWAAFGLLEAYRQTAEQNFLDGALRWHKFQVDTMGFQESGNELAVNYFANHECPRVPNASTDMLRFLSELADVTGTNSFLQPAAGLRTFLQNVQKPTGEFPYAVAGVNGGKDRPHYQCYQYNAFECLNLMRCYELTEDAVVLRLISKVLGFLCEGLAESGHVFYQCGNRHRQVTYHTAVLSAAFTKAGQIGISGYNELANRAYQNLLGSQRPDGSFTYSRRDYYLLSDKRSYPRYLAMILLHLLYPNPAMESEIA